MGELGRLEADPMRAISGSIAAGSAVLIVIMEEGNRRGDARPSSLPLSLSLASRL